MQNLFATRQSAPAIIVVDDFYAEPDQIRAMALQQEFQHNPEDHKGQRTRIQFIDPSIRDRLECLLQQKITSWSSDKYGYNGVFQFCIGGDKIVFHSDIQRWAGVVYLTPNAPPSAGTTLYRSKATLLRKVNPETAASMALNMEQAMRLTYKDKLLDPTAWEVVDVIGNVYNRLVLWDGRLIHAASNYFGTTLANSRLFQMFFLDTEEA